MNPPGHILASHLWLLSLYSEQLHIDHNLLIMTSLFHMQLWDVSLILLWEEN